MPPQVAATARASGCGETGAPSRPAATSSRPTRERIATPFHVGSPCVATAYPRLGSSPRSRSANAAAPSFVSCRHTTSGRRSSSHGSSRGTRCLTELTFQVAIRTSRTVRGAPASNIAVWWPRPSETLGCVTVTTPPGRLATDKDSRPNTSGGQRDAEMLRRYALTRDPQLREQLVHRYLPLARYAASQYRRGSEPFDDLMQVASVGLLKAIARYDPARGAAFSSYALPTMSGELRRHFRDRSWAVRPPRDLQEQAMAVEKAVEALGRDLGRSPTVEETADRVDLDVEQVLEAREALTARMSTSLSTPVRGHEDDELDLGSRLGHDDDGFAAAEHRATLTALSKVLTAREREIVRLRFEQDLTQAEIGTIVGLSQMHVSRVLRAAVEKLRTAARG